MTRRLVFAVAGIAAIAACGKGGTADKPCPTADQLLRGRPETPPVRRAYTVTSESCTKDKWSPAVIECLRKATDEDAEDKCLDALTKDQQEHLRDALRSMSIDQKRLNFVTFMADVHKLEETPGLFHDAPECADYRKAAIVALSLANDCGQIDDFQLAPARASYLGSLRQLLAFTEREDLVAECKQRAQAIRDDETLKCPPAQ